MPEQTRTGQDMPEQTRKGQDRPGQAGQACTGMCTGMCTCMCTTPYTPVHVHRPTYTPRRVHDVTDEYERAWQMCTFQGLCGVYGLTFGEVYRMNVLVLRKH